MSDDLIERLCERAGSYRLGGPSSEHTASLLTEAADALAAKDTALSEMRAELERVKAALEPFGKDADNWADSVPDDYRPRCTEPGKEYAHPGSEAAFTVGDLRAARALAPSIQDEPGPDLGARG